PLWASTTAVREPLERVDRCWRGIVMDTYALEKLTGWTPELSPPPDSPLYCWRQLGGEPGTLRGNNGFACGLGPVMSVPPHRFFQPPLCPGAPPIERGEETSSRPA